MNLCTFGFSFFWSMSPEKEMQSILATPMSQASRGQRSRDTHKKGTPVCGHKCHSHPCCHDELPLVPRNSWWVLSPTTSGQQSSDLHVAALPRGERDEASPPLLHPSESRCSPIVTRLSPRGQDHKVLGLGVTAQGGADDMIDGVILIHLLNQLHTPVGRLKSGLRGHSSLRWPSEQPWDGFLTSTQLSRDKKGGDPPGYVHA